MRRLDRLHAWIERKTGIYFGFITSGRWMLGVRVGRGDRCLCLAEVRLGRWGLWLDHQPGWRE